MTGATWDQVLGGFEAELARAEDLLAADPSLAGDLVALEWVPPQGIGPLPVEHADRAGAVLARQRSALERLRSAAARTRTELQLMAALRAGPRRPVPTFVDRDL